MADQNLLDPSTPIIGARGETALDFWRWAVSDLVSNANRGVVAEYLVGLALGALDQPRVEWDQVDLRYRHTSIEVKASGRGQSWDRPGAPIITRRPNFTIAPRAGWDAATNTSATEPGRLSDCFVFCVHTPTRPSAADVLDVRTWEFLVWSTQAIDRTLGNQKTIALSRLRQLARPCEFSGIKDAVDQELASMNNALATRTFR